MKLAVIPARREKYVRHVRDELIDGRREACMDVYCNPAVNRDCLRFTAHLFTMRGVNTEARFTTINNVAQIGE